MRKLFCLAPALRSGSNKFRASGRWMLLLLLLLLGKKLPSDLLFSEHYYKSPEAFISALSSVFFRKEVEKLSTSISRWNVWVRPKAFPKCNFCSSHRQRVDVYEEILAGKGCRVHLFIDLPFELLAQIDFANSGDAVYVAIISRKLPFERLSWQGTLHSNGSRIVPVICENNPIKNKSQDYRTKCFKNHKPKLLIVT